jgi:transcriptional regulator with XRE-family HTH domain
MEEINFSPVFRKARLDLNLTQTEMATLLEIIPSHISFLERNERQPSLETIGKLAAAMDVLVTVVIMDAEIPAERFPLVSDLRERTYRLQIQAMLMAMLLRLKERDEALAKDAASVTDEDLPEAI